MAVTLSNNSRKLWDYFRKAGCSDWSVAGLMGNLWAESGLRSNNLQDSNEKKIGLTDVQYTNAVDIGTYSPEAFENDKAGYGLAQWTWHTRKAKLLAFAKSKRKSIGDFDMQVDFLLSELTGSYGSLWTILKTAKNVRSASDAVLTQFEVPYDMSETVRRTRAGYGEEFFRAYSGVGQGVTGGSGVSGGINTGIDWNTPCKTAEELAKRCRAVAQGYKTLYVHGCFGAAMKESVKKYYYKNTSYNAQPERQAMIRAASADTFGFDCVCLIKGILWGWRGDASAANGGAVYRSNSVPDINADMMINQCSGVSRDFSRIEVGEALWMQGHIGIYIGGGLAVECTPKWENKVQITSVNRYVAGYNRRDWTSHGKLPYVSYTGKADGEKPVSVSEKKSFKVGDIVTFAGGSQYYSSMSLSPASIKAKPGKAKITVVATSSWVKHPYHLVGVSGGSDVFGWVDGDLLT